MKRILTLAAAASIAGTSAFAAAHAEMPEEMTMLSGKVNDILTECSVEMEDEDAMNLTMAQVSGIVLAGNSEDGSEKCQTVESILQDSM